MRERLLRATMESIEIPHARDFGGRLFPPGVRAESAPEIGDWVVTHREALLEFMARDGAPSIPLSVPWGCPRFPTRIRSRMPIGSHLPTGSFPPTRPPRTCRSFFTTKWRRHHGPRVPCSSSVNSRRPRVALRPYVDPISCGNIFANATPYLRLTAKTRGCATPT